MNYEIKEVKYNDIDTLCYVNDVCFKETYKDILSNDYLNSLDLNSYIEDSKEDYQNNLYKSYILYLDQEPVGNICLGKSRLEDYPESGEIYSLYLLSKVQGKGFGKILFNFGINKLKEEYDEIIVCCLENNLKANQFYSHMNFKLVGKKACLMGNNKYIENIYYSKFN